MPQQTLNEKAFALQESVALPDTSNWCLGDSITARKAVKELNAALVESLTTIKSHNGLIMITIAHLIMEPLAKVAAQYPKLDIFSSEGYQTIALFFAVNYDPTIYHFLRYEVPVPRFKTRRFA